MTFLDGRRSIGVLNGSVCWELCELRGHWSIVGSSKETLVPFTTLFLYGLNRELFLKTGFCAATTFHPALGIVISAGRRVEHTLDGVSFSSLSPPMPAEKQRHCICAFDGGSKLFAAGGLPPGNGTLVYDAETRAWRAADRMPTMRKNASCGVAKNGRGEEEVVVAGGSGFGERWQECFDVVEIWNAETGQWRKGTERHQFKASSITVHTSR